MVPVKKKCSAIGNRTVRKSAVQMICGARQVVREVVEYLELGL